MQRAPTSIQTQSDRFGDIGMPDLMQITSADELCNYVVYTYMGHTSWFWTYARSPEHNIHIICADLRGSSGDLLVIF
jgi:hypothetical protein